MSKASSSVRHAEVERNTKETKVYVNLGFDAGTKQDISTGLGFFDHMLHQFGFHGQLNLGVNCEGDTHVDDHHTVEDVGITLGIAIRQALEGASIKRYASIHVPMDDALVLVALDISGRGYLGWNIEFTREKIGDLSTECISEFFKSLAHHAGITLHIHKIAGENNHHICEAAFKGLGIALNMAASPSDRKGPTSTKGVVE
ncbi:MAG: imidazoleglycerol-phosphate dehydratase HisB [Fimbriimonadaceae bacterium]|nr:imidazoleglycerol-phosphate dehydratase HisB [Fimbriimonadaceae bacterium]